MAKPKKKQKTAPMPLHEVPSLAVRAALRALERNGRITPELVLSEAVKPTSPLHDHFEWDDTKAAHRWRLVQARELIRSVKVRITSENRNISVVRYVRDPEAEATEQGYVALQQLQKEPHAAQVAVQYEFTRAEACLIRARKVAAALGLEEEVDSVVKHVARVRKKVERKAA